MRFKAAFGASVVAGSAKECTYSLEILQVQDGSSSFRDEIQNMARFMEELTSDLRDTYGEFKFGVSSFVDKPIPLRGYGPYGNWNNVAGDYCYRSHSAMTEDNEDIVAGLTELAGNLGSGNDFPENPMEALIFAAADGDAGWSPINVTHAESGRPIVRIIMLVTDDIPHFPTDAEDAIARFWNWPRTITSTNPLTTSGGFGAHNFHNIASTPTVNVASAQDHNDYIEMADLFAEYDYSGDLSNVKAERLDNLIAKFGPYPFPDVVEHPGDDSIPDCTKTEYPTLEQVSKYLKARNMNIIFLLAEPPAYARPMTEACGAIGMSPGVPCLVELYKEYASAMEISAVVAGISGDDTKDRILESIIAMTDMMCLTETTKAPESTLSETSSSATTEPDMPATELPVATEPPVVTELPIATEIPVITDHPVVTEEPSEAVRPTSDLEQPITEPESSSYVGGLHPSEPATAPEHPTMEETGKLEETTTAKTESETSSDNTSVEEMGTTDDESSNVVVVVPPVLPDVDAGGSGPNVGVIAGAAAGGAAAIVLAGVLYSKFGGVMFGGAVDPAQVAMQVETPENPVERETVEEVTMDMFQ